MTATLKGIIAKISNLIQSFKKATPSQPLTEQEQKELAYTRYRASIELSDRKPVTVHQTVKRASTALKTAPSTRLVVSGRMVKSQVIDLDLFKLTNGKYGIIDTLEGDATNLVLA